MIGHTVRLAMRSLRRAPGFTTAAVTSLALGLAFMLSVRRSGGGGRYRKRIVIAYACAPLLRRLLDRVHPLDVAVLTATSGVVTLLAGSDTWWPVRRALRVPLVRGLQDD